MKNITKMVFLSLLCLSNMSSFGFVRLARVAQAGTQRALGAMRRGAVKTVHTQGFVGRKQVARKIGAAGLMTGLGAATGFTAFSEGEQLTADGRPLDSLIEEREIMLARAQEPGRWKILEKEVIRYPMLHEYFKLQDETAKLASKRSELAQKIDREDGSSAQTQELRAELTDLDNQLKTAKRSMDMQTWKIQHFFGMNPQLWLIEMLRIASLEA